MSPNLVIPIHGPTPDAKWCRLPSCKEPWPCRTNLQAQVKRLPRERDEAHRQLAAVVEALDTFPKIAGCLYKRLLLAGGTAGDCEHCKPIMADIRRVRADLPAAAQEIAAKLELHEGHILRREEPESTGLQQLGVHLSVCVTCEWAEKLAEALKHVLSEYMHWVKPQREAAGWPDGGPYWQEADAALREWERK